jgi:hypothetical protein
MIIQKRKQTSQNHEESAPTRLDSTHCRRLLCLLYGPGAEDEQLWDDSYIQEIEEALSTIATRQSYVMHQRLLGKELEEIAVSFESTRERIRQIENQAIRRLRHRPRLGIIYHLRLRLCQYPKQSLRGPRISQPKLCIHCGQPENKTVRFPPCTARIEQLRAHAHPSPSNPQAPER